MQNYDTRPDKLLQWEAATWLPIETIPGDQSVLVYIPADRFGGQSGEDGWMREAEPGDWIRHHATLWRPLLPLTRMPLAAGSARQP
jgi:hypothetical protein